MSMQYLERNYKEEESFNREEVVCPYDNKHKMLRNRLIFHLAKCRAKVEKQHLFAHCPYNFLHIFLKQEIDSHTQECGDRQFLEKFYVIQKEQNEYKYEQEDPTYTWVGVMDSLDLEKQKNIQTNLVQGSCNKINYCKRIINKISQLLGCEKRFKYQ